MLWKRLNTIATKAPRTNDRYYGFVVLMLLLECCDTGRSDGIRPQNRLLSRKGLQGETIWLSPVTKVRPVLGEPNGEVKGNFPIVLFNGVASRVGCLAPVPTFQSITSCFGSEKNESGMFGALIPSLGWLPTKFTRATRVPVLALGHHARF